MDVRDCPLTCSSVSHHTNSSDGQQSSKRLRDLIVKTRLSDFLDEDSVCLLGNFDLLPCDWAKNADSKTWSWEGMSANQMGGNAEQSA